MNSKIAQIAGPKPIRPEPHSDPKVRAARVQGHDVFDLLWKEYGLTRNQAYRWLSKRMGYSFHFGNAELAECRRATKICEEYTQCL